MREQMFYKDLILLDLDVRNADAFWFRFGSTFQR